MKYISLFVFATFVSTIAIPLPENNETIVDTTTEKSNNANSQLTSNIQNAAIEQAPTPVTTDSAVEKSKIEKREEKLEDPISTTTNETSQQQAETSAQNTKEKREAIQETKPEILNADNNATKEENTGDVKPNTELKLDETKITEAPKPEEQKESPKTEEKKEAKDGNNGEVKTEFSTEAPNAVANEETTPAVAS